MIIVLTLGRSGSSLLMQTLAELGVSILGFKFDQHVDKARMARHQHHNPKGYFEEPRIYYGGPKSDTFQFHIKETRFRQACKMDLRHLSDDAQMPYWRTNADRISAILISFRDPCEQAYSEYSAAVSQTGGNDADRFMFMTTFLSGYVDAFNQTKEILNGFLKELQQKTHYISYATAAHPAQYVAEIVEKAALLPEAEQIQNAIDNITPALYRVQRQDLQRQDLDWAKRLRADDTYQGLRALERK